MEWIIETIILVVIPLLLLILGFSAGTLNERRHLRSLRRREEQVSGFLVTNVRTYLAPGPGPEPALILGEVVVATDYFKTFAASLKKLIGGELRTYEKLMDRARREALLRVQEQAVQLGYNAICNVRLDFANVGGIGATKQAKATMVAVLASATAYSVRRV
jgi:uncharacterized protein YbjQ (UPF0145 family)